MKIIFLDIDGVLNCETAYKNGYCKYTTLLEWDGDPKDNHYQTWYPPSKDLLNQLILETGAKIVISSTWRNSGLKWMKAVWKSEAMEGEIIDITPDLRYMGLGKEHRVNIPRGLEIEWWLNQKGYSDIYWSKDLQQEYIDKSGIENYIIIDDDGDMLYNQSKHFVHTLPSPRNKKGFCRKYYLEALEKLSKTSVELNYE